MTIKILLLVFFFVVPVVLLYFKVIPFRYKIHTLTFVALAIGVIMFAEKWSASKLGLDANAVSSYWLPYLLFTIVLTSAVFVVAKLLKRKGTIGWRRDTHFLYGFILVSVIQEYIFRGFLIPELQSFITSPILVILVNTLLFTFMHIIYSDNGPALMGIFIGGICFATMYVYYPSLILVMISHTILNFVVVYYGFFSQERLTKTSPGL